MSLNTDEAQIGSAIPDVKPSRSRHFGVLINEKAGEVLQRGRQAFADTISAGLQKAGATCDIRFVKPKRLSAVLGDMLGDTSSARKPAAVLIAGGDGTINRLLPQMMSSPVPIGLLPLGTLNLLGRDLGLEGNIADVIDTLVNAEVAATDLGDVNGKLFHSNAGLGFFARMAREREDTRQLVPVSKTIGFLLAVVRATWLHRPITVDIEINGKVETFVTDAVLVTNNHFHGSDWRRDNLDTGKLEVHMLHASGIWGRLRAAIAVYRGTWRSLDHLQSATARTITIRRRGKARSKIALDGEIFSVTNPIQFRSRPSSVKLLSGQRAVGTP
jgi:diacylglycerol kinase family enzyme